MPAASITPVLVTYNSETILDWSLPALRACADVVVVDNHSSDGTVDRAQALLPQARVVCLDSNLGFGRANNLGLATVQSDYALLLNPDAQLEPGALDALADAAARYPEAAILAPVLYDAPGQVGDFFRGPFHAPACKPAPEPVGDLCADFVTGAAMLLNMRLMREVGFFDPWFFLYFEDDDLCLRVRRAGHPIIVVREARLQHRPKQSSRPSARTTFRRMYCMTLSKLYITRKYLGTGSAVRMAVRIGLGSALALVPALLAVNSQRLLRQLARCTAALAAPLHLRRAHCFEPRA